MLYKTEGLPAVHLILAPRLIDERLSSLHDVMLYSVPSSTYPPPTVAKLERLDIEEIIIGKSC